MSIRGTALERGWDLPGARRYLECVDHRILDAPRVGLPCRSLAGDRGNFAPAADRA